MYIKIIPFVFLFSVLIPFTSEAQTFDANKLDSLINYIDKNNRGMGSISLFHEGKEIYQKSCGYENLGDSVKATAKTKYRIGSISKTFTAAIIMKLVQDKKLTLETTLSEFYPQIENADKITISHLLQHRSGIDNFTDHDYYSFNTQAHTKEKLLEKIGSHSNKFEPDEKIQYSNSNYVLLTFIAEDVSKRKYSELLQRYISKPCSLKNTYAGGKINPNEYEAFSYKKNTNWELDSETDMSIPLGAGNIVSTPTDLNKFLFGLFDDKIIKTEKLYQMLKLKDNYGYGIFQVPFYDKKGFGHTGGIDGFHSAAYYFPDEKLSIAITSNGMAFPINDIIIGALSIYFGKKYDFPEFKEAVTIDSDDLEKYLGVYSGNNFPLKLIIKKEDNTLIAQGSGQPSFPLEYVGENTFVFETARIEILFHPEEASMTFKQNGMTFELMKECSGELHSPNH